MNVDSGSGGEPRDPLHDRAAAGQLPPAATVAGAEQELGDLLVSGEFDQGAGSPDAIMASFRRFYFDTALASGAALPTLKAFASPGHILFGTDSPYDHGASAAFTATLDASDTLTADDHTAISHRNAQALFPRLASYPTTAVRSSPDLR